MLAHQSGKVLLVVSLVLLTSGEVVDAQIFVRHPHGEKHAPEPWCGIQGCPAKLESFGYFHENWRRWPGEGATTARDELSPFVTPDREIPEAVVPEARDEASQIQRDRSPVRRPSAGFTPAPSPSVPDTIVPDSTPADQGFDAGDLPNDLLDNPDGGGAFPSGDLPADEVDEAFPSGDLPADELDPGLPGDDEEDIFNPDSDDSLDDSLNDLPGLNEGELDEFDLDLGLRGPQRSQAQATPATAVPRQINLVSAQSLEEEVHVHIRTATSRKNPLRRIPTRFASQRQTTAKPQPRRKSKQSVAPASFSRPIPTATRPAAKPRPRRANPLR